MWSWKRHIYCLQRYNFTTVRPRTFTKMERAMVRSVQSEERLELTFSFGLEGKKQRFYTFNRIKDEELARTLARIGTNVFNKSIKPKSKKQKLKNPELEGEETVEVTLHQNGTKISDEVHNLEAWTNGSILHIGTTQFEVIINSPTIRTIKLPDCIMAGFTIYPNIDAEFVNLEHCKYKWYKSSDFTGNESDNKSTDETVVAPSSSADKDVDSDKGSRKKQTRTNSETKTAKNVEDWIHLTVDYSFTPDNTHIGHKLKVCCIPSDGSRSGDEQDCVSKHEVSAGPGLCPFETRHLFTESPADSNSMRVMSYNLLADIYADSEFSRTTLFPHCPAYALAMEYRKHLIIKELHGYNADIICLQEVDRKIFLNDLQPSLEQRGFEGTLKGKSDDVREGTATFYRKDKFKLLDQHDIKVRDALQTEETLKELWEKISENSAMKEKVEGRSTIFQVSVLESINDPSRCVIVGTTHLYFRPTAGNVRLVQTAVCLDHLQKLKQIYTKQGKVASVLFCGDLNSYPKSGAVELITSGKVLPSNEDWSSAGEEMEIKAPELSHNLHLTSACGFPEYTNYVLHFQGCIDYIFMDKSLLEVENVVPMPSHEEVIQYRALPNPVFPSDHLALICDVKWKQ